MSTPNGHGEGQGWLQLDLDLDRHRHLTRNVLCVATNGSVRRCSNPQSRSRTNPAVSAHTHTATVRAVCCRQHCSTVCGRYHTVHTTHSTTTSEIPPSSMNMFINRTRNHWMVVSTWYCAKAEGTFRRTHYLNAAWHHKFGCNALHVPLCILNEAGCATIWPCRTARLAFRRSSSLCQAQWLTPVVSYVQIVQPGRYDCLPNHSHTFTSCAVA